MSNTVSLIMVHLFFIMPMRSFSIATIEGHDSVQPEHTVYCLAGHNELLTCLVFHSEWCL